MTRDEILAKQPGRELDCLVIQHVFRKPLWSERPNWYLLEGTPDSSEKTYCKVPRFSKDISAAWEVVEKFKWIQVKKYETVGDEIRFTVYIEHNEYQEVSSALVIANTAPEAICKAALLAVIDQI